MLPEIKEMGIPAQYLVHQCKDCLFSDNYGLGECRAIEGPDGKGRKLKDRMTTHVWPASPPEWCPLRDGVVVVRMAPAGAE